MVLVIQGLFWICLGLYGASLLTVVLAPPGGAPKTGVKSMLTMALSVNLIMFCTMIVSGKWPADYEFMNSLCKSFYAATAIYLSLNRLKSRLPVIIGLMVVLFFPLSRIYMSGTLWMQDGMAHAFGPFTVLFYQFSSIATGVWGYTFALCISHLVNRSNGSPGGVKTTGLIFSTCLWGFLAFSFAQVAGSIWAITSGWGDVWVWASSHLFSGLLWIFYAGMLHVPTARKLNEKTMPVMGVVGFAYIIVFTFYHEYAIQPAYNILRTMIDFVTAGGVA